MDDLVGEVVVDVGGLLGQGGGLVHDVLAAVGGVQRRVGGVLVDRHHVQRGVVALVEEELVALAHDDDVPGVDGARGAHEHRQDAVRGEDGRLVLVRQLLDDGVGGRGDIVRGAVDGGELLLGALDGLLIIGAVVVVEEPIVVHIFALVGVEVQLGQAVEVDLLQQLPVRLDIDARVPVAGRLVVVLPAEATPPRAAGTAAPTIVAPTTTTATTAAAASAAWPGAVQLRPAPARVAAAAAPLAAAAAREDGTATVSGPGAVADVADDGEGALVLGLGGAEGGGVVGAVCLLVWIYEVSYVSFERASTVWC